MYRFFFNMRSWILLGTLKFTYGEGESMARGSGLGCDLEEEIPPEGGWLVPPVWEQVLWRDCLYLLCL